jgi:hypothetical protein
LDFTSTLTQRFNPNNEAIINKPIYEGYLSEQHM